MKRIVSTALTVFMLSSIAQAQDAQGYLNKASENIKSKNYKEALKNLGEAKKIVNDLLGGQLSEALPAQVGEWKMNVPEDFEPGMSGSPNMVSVRRIYTNAAEEKKRQEEVSNMPENLDPAMMMMEEEPKINVTVSNDMMIANEVMMAHSDENFSMGSPDEFFEATRIKGYRATVRFNKQYGSGAVTVIAGSGVVRIEPATRFDDKDILVKIAEAVNYETVKSILGE